MIILAQPLVTSDPKDGHEKQLGVTYRYHLFAHGFLQLWMLCTSQETEPDLLNLFEFF